MRVATWNVNGLRSRLEFLKIWLRERRPDAVALQELKLEDEQFPYEELEAEGYFAAVHGQKAWNGVAVLARERPEPVQKGLPGEDEAGSRLLTAKVGPVFFTSVYCPNGKSVDHEDFGRKLAWFDSLASHLAAAALSPAIVGGDFNLCPQAIDSYNDAGKAGKIFHTAEERSRFQNLLDLGLVDLYRRRHPERQVFSWWDYRAGAFHKNRGLRIDFLLGTQDLLAGASGEIEIDREFRKKHEGLTPSDHAPVWADLQI